jgi:transposase
MIVNTIALVMKKIVKQVAGIDVAQNELVVQLGRMFDDWTPELHALKTFPNTAQGFAALLSWVNRLPPSDIPTRYVMEATGVYHECLAYYLVENGCEVTIVLPNKISNYMRTLEQKTMTDKTAAQSIALFGLERKLEPWTKPQAIYQKLRQLTRERSQLIELKTICKNQLHAEQSEAEGNKKSMARLKKRIDLLDKQEREILAEIKELIKTDPAVQQVVVLLCSITGVGLLTAATVLGETNGFDLICNKRQLTSYAGLDVREKQSGTSIKGKPRISKKGNKHLRKAMYLPALAAIRHDEHYKAVFTRLVAKDGIKMKAAVAVQRKLLEMMFTIFKKGEKYDSNYCKNQIEEMAPIETEKN